MAINAYIQNDSGFSYEVQVSETFYYIDMTFQIVVQLVQLFYQV